MYVSHIHDLNSLPVDTGIVAFFILNKREERIEEKRREKNKKNSY
jgi:hypothetical protein